MSARKNNTNNNDDALELERLVALQVRMGVFPGVVRAIDDRGVRIQLIDLETTVLNLFEVFFAWSEILSALIAPKNIDPRAFIEPMASFYKLVPQGPDQVPVPT